MASSLLGVFAKQPSAGQVKTRLAQASSPAWAERVAQAFLEDTLDRLGQIAATRAIVYAPPSATDFFEEIAGGRFDLIPQADGDLGQRLQHFFHHGRSRGFTEIIAVGTDSPTFHLEWIEQAFQLLTLNDVVIGPAFDGGYCLIGLGVVQFPIFDTIPWSTACVLEATVERLRGTSAKLALLPPWYDVDTVDDWALLRGHVLAMRRAGQDPGVPHTERLILEATCGKGQS